MKPRFEIKTAAHRDCVSASRRLQGGARTIVGALAIVPNAFLRLAFCTLTLGVSGKDFDALAPVRADIRDPVFGFKFVPKSTNLAFSYQLF
jgi:hypothetical protein